MPISYRRQPGRPGREELPAPTTRIRWEIPQDMLAVMLRIAKRRELTRQGALRESVAEWIERYGKPEDFNP